jgi:hypothetical protein
LIKDAVQFVFIQVYRENDMTIFEIVRIQSLFIMNVVLLVVVAKAKQPANHSQRCYCGNKHETLNKMTPHIAAKKED